MYVTIKTGTNTEERRCICLKMTKHGTCWVEFGPSFGLTSVRLKRDLVVLNASWHLHTGPQTELSAQSHKVQQLHEANKEQSETQEVRFNPNHHE